MEMVLFVRCRPWYGSTATYPKEMVIMIDKSRSMQNSFGPHRKMYYGIQSTKDVIDSLNPNDNVRIQGKAPHYSWFKQQTVFQSLNLYDCFLCFHPLFSVVLLYCETTVSASCLVNPRRLLRVHIVYHVRFMTKITSLCPLRYFFSRASFNRKTRYR